MVDLFKFASNKKILSGVVTLGYNLVCNQTLSIKKSHTHTHTHSLSLSLSLSHWVMVVMVGDGLGLILEWVTVGSWVCGWVDGLILEWVLPRKVFLGGGLWMGFFLGYGLWWWLGG